MKIQIFSYNDGGYVPHTPITIDAAAPEETPPRRIRAVLKKWSGIN